LGGGPNGATEGPDGSIYVTQNGGCWPALNHVRAESGIQVVARDGSVRYLTRVPKSPNDLAFGPDGLLYITDPTRKPERDEGRVWACDIATGECRLVLECDWYPNGIGFGREDGFVYVADSRHKRIVRFPLNNGGLGPLEEVCALKRGSPDGFAFDLENNLVIACPGSETVPGTVQVWSASGQLLELMEPGKARFYTNLALAADGSFYLCASDAGMLLKGRWRSAGLALHPFR
jgi:gluconolactonase